MKVGIVTPMDPRTGISTYSVSLAMELQKLGVKVSIISLENSSNRMLIQDEIIKIVQPENYDVEDYDITHFQLANSYLHEFQLHILQNHYKKLMNNSNIITTVHDARNFDAFNLKCFKCINFGIRSIGIPPTYPYDIVDKGFQRISKYIIFHNKSAMDEYKTRYKLDKEVLRRIPIPAYRIAKTKNISNVETDSNEKRFLVPGYISPFKGQDILIKDYK